MQVVIIDNQKFAEVSDAEIAASTNLVADVEMTLSVWIGGSDEQQGDPGMKLFLIRDWP